MATPTTPRRTIADLDVPREQVEAEAAVLRREIAREAELHSDAQVSALSLSLHLVTHPEVRVSEDADYPGWTPRGAA
jgi:hypothetical protein